MQACNKKVVTRFALLQAAALLLLLLLGRVTAAEMARECIEEPVFNGVACVYQANKGARQTVVLVHGINGNALEDWAKQIDALAPDYHVVAVDLPGFGASSRDNQLYSPRAYAEFLHFITARYAPVPFHLVGHSMGGAVALRYAAQYPEEVDRLVLIDVAGILHRISFTKELVGAWVEKKTGKSGGFLERMAGKLLEKVDGLASNSGAMLSDEDWRQRKLEGDPSQIAGMALLDDNFGPVLTAVRAPTLIIWGADDPVAPLRTGRVLAARLSANRLEIIPGVGHVPMQQAAARTNELLRGFLAAPAEALPTPRPAFMPLLQPPTTDRVGRCEDDSGTREFTGDWQRIELRHCEGVKIHDARVGHLEMFESRVAITDTQLVGERPVRVVGSEVEITGGAVQGRVAIEAERSRLDVAGTVIIGTTTAITAPEESNVTLSVSELHSPHTAGPIHTYRVVMPGQPL